jgi:DNA-binding NtrC family response regulator
MKVSGSIRRTGEKPGRLAASRQSPPLLAPPGESAHPGLDAAPNGSSKTLEDIERVHILRILEECGGNQSHAADILDIDRVTLYHKLKKYGWSRASSARAKKPDEVAP